MKSQDWPQIRDSHPQLAEIEDLLSFAEKVADSVLDLRRNLSGLRIWMMFGFAFSYICVCVAGITVFNLQRTDYTFPVTVLALGLAATGALFVWTRIQLRRRTQNELEVEARILGDLIPMISSLLEPIEGETSAVARKLLSMRLRRIRFSDAQVK